MQDRNTNNSIDENCYDNETVTWALAAKQI